MDKDYLSIILGIIALILIMRTPGIESKLWCLVLSFVSVVALSLSFLMYGKTFIYGIIASGIGLGGCSFAWAKIKGERVLVGVNWITLLLGILLTVVGLLLYDKYEFIS